jgi:alpha-beta hydrolase superfamily lysophospholipase
MRFRSDSPTGPDLPTPAQALQQIQQQLALQQQVWAAQLARDPATLAQLEPQIHLAFGQLADQLVASLLAHAAQQPALADAAKKK